MPLIDPFCVTQYSGADRTPKDIMLNFMVIPKTIEADILRKILKTGRGEKLRL